jgi:para-nitrobenzyl esterase
MKSCVLLSLGLVLAACDLLSGDASDPLHVEVDGGTVVGAFSGEDEAVLVFRGVPYAAPPLGALRWAPPAPVEAWEGLRPATTPPPACMQIARPEGSFYGPGAERTSEDCLYLNVWAAADGSGPRPVLVWIHGGGLRNGWGGNPAYDGEALARRGATVVTINYRLGPFGFFAHPELSAETVLDASGNWGILDQIVALQWVQRNIAAFGGDADRVTVFGESAGSRSVNYLMASPLAQGLFHRAMGESSATFADALLLRDDPDEPSAEEQGRELARLLLTDADAAAATDAAHAADPEVAPPDGAATGEPGSTGAIAALRALPADQVLEVVKRHGGPRRYQAIVDGWVLPASAWEVFSSGRQANVPLLVGWNADEGTALVGDGGPHDLESYRETVRRTWGEVADELLELYAAQSDDEARAAFLRAYGASGFGWNVRTWARFMENVGSPAYLYYFRRVPPGPESERYGAYHAAEIPYLFGNLERSSRPYDDSDRALSDLMGRYLLNFAASGNPNGGELPEWPPYITEKGATMVFDVEPRVEDHVRAAELELFDRFQKIRRRGSRH